MTGWNVSISATPPRMARPRSASAATMPQNSRFARCSSGIPKYEKSRRKTNRLSSDSERSMK